MKSLGASPGANKSRLDGVFLFCVAALIILGSMAVSSAVRPLAYYHQALERHFIALGFGTLLFFAAANFVYQVYEDQSVTVYGSVLAILIAVLVIGSSHKGHRSWIQLGFFAFQPSEFARLGLILVLAAVLDKRENRIEQLSTILISVAVLIPVVALIIKQPDFSMTLTLFPIFFGMLFCAGAIWEHLAVFLGFGISAAVMPFLYVFLDVYYPHPHARSLPSILLAVFHFKLAAFLAVFALGIICAVIWYFNLLMRKRLRISVFVLSWVILSGGMLTGIVVSQKLKGYQRSRFTAYIDPGSDLRGSAYHVRQSQIAIGSGGLLGKGLFAGTQSQLGFLPERHTDFIYAVIGEESGFIGSALVLGLYLLMIGRIVQIGMIARDRYGYLVCSGIATMFAFDLLLNVGMCLGLMPVAGIPLPLVSYGGSSLMASLWSLGIVANIGKRRYALL